MILKSISALLGPNYVCCAFNPVKMRWKLKNINAIKIFNPDLMNDNYHTGESKEIAKKQVNKTNHVPLIERSKQFLRNSPKYKNSVYNENNPLFTDLSAESRTKIATVVNSPEFFFNLKKQRFSSDTFLTLVYYLGNNNQSVNWSIILDCSKKYINQLNNKQIQQLLFLLVKYDIPCDDKFLRSLDLGCSKYITVWDITNCLLALDLWYALIDDRMLEGTYMKLLLREWESKLFTFPLHHLIQLLFYLGLYKKCPVFLHNIEIAIDKQIEILNTEELMIICSIFFKNSHKIKSQNILEIISLNFKESLRSDCVDCSALINFCKVLRHSRYFNFATMSELVHVLNNGLLHKLNLLESAHIIATLANFKIYENNLYNSLEKQIMHVLHAENISILNKTYGSHMNIIHPSMRSRLKDIARILWIFSETSHRIQNSQFLKDVAENLSLAYDKKLFEKYPCDLLDCLVSLAILGYFPDNLINVALSSNFVRKIEAEQSTKQLKQLILLDQSVMIESSFYKGLRRLKSNFESILEQDLINELNNEKLKRFHLQKLENIFNNADVKGVSKQLPIARLLPHIPISGISCFTNSSGKIISNKDSDISINKTAIEVLDTYVCRYGTFHPCGLMNMKLRQLRQLGYKIIAIPSSEIERLNENDPEEIFSFLEVISKKYYN